MLTCPHATIAASGGIAMNLALRAAGGAPHAGGTLPQILCGQRCKQQVGCSASLTQGQQCEPCANAALLWAAAQASSMEQRDPCAGDNITTSLGWQSHKPHIGTGITESLALMLAAPFGGVHAHGLFVCAHTQVWLHSHLRMCA